MSNGRILSDLFPTGDTFLILLWKDLPRPGDRTIDGGRRRRRSTRVAKRRFFRILFGTRMRSTSGDSHRAVEPGCEAWARLCSSTCFANRCSWEEVGRVKFRIPYNSCTALCGSGRTIWTLHHWWLLLLFKKQLGGICLFAPRFSWQNVLHRNCILEVKKRDLFGGFYGSFVCCLKWAAYASSALWLTISFFVVVKWILCFTYQAFSALKPHFVS